MTDYKQFVFESYDFDSSTKIATFSYSYDSELYVTETYLFDFNFVEYDAAALNRALEILFFMAGVSYYKLYLAAKIVVNAGQIDSVLAKFLNLTYRHGLGEFCYINQLPLLENIFKATISNLNPTPAVTEEGKLIALGGGKDSLVSVELLRGTNDIATWSVGHKQQLEPLVQKIGLPHYWVERTYDPKILGLNKKDAYNGHVPISAILACAGAVLAVLAGVRDIVVSNEQSANEPTLLHNGEWINHQYSKSQQFEESFQALLRANFGHTIRYYSLLRPFSELNIAEQFSKFGFEIYKDVFCSCNQAFTHGKTNMTWDGTCAKCAFVFLALTPFVERTELEKIFGGKNLLLNPSLTQTYEQLLGISGEKPLDCVGEIRESRAAMRLAQKIYPTLDNFDFELDSTYDFRAWQHSSIPPEVLKQLESKLG